MKTTPFLVAGILTVTCLNSVAFAQSRSSSAMTGATNYDYAEVEPLSLYLFSSDYNTNGTMASAGVDRDFTGTDNDGNSRTMNFTGHAAATGDYGILRTSAYGSLSNIFNNSFDNEPFWNSDTDEVNEEGIPDGFAAIARASYSDVLQFGGTATGYKSRYTFHIHGTVSGTDAYTYLDVTIAGNLEEFTVPGTGNISEFFTTEAYPIAGPGQTMNVSLSSQYLPNAFGPDGSDFSGASLFGQTVSLVGIQVEDETGNPVTGWTVTADSGTSYPIPEPGTMTLLSAAALMLMARTRRSRNR